jgi:hypothetical protein
LEGDRDIQRKAALQQATLGDSQAFAELVQAHQTMVFNIAGPLGWRSPRLRPCRIGWHASEPGCRTRWRTGIIDQGFGYSKRS